MYSMVKKIRSSVSTDVEDAANIGMRDAARDADFVAESLQGLLAPGKLRQELERDLLAQAEIVSTVHLAHAASAQQRDDP